MKMWHPTALVADRLPPAGPASSEPWTTLRVEFDDEEQALFLVLGMGSRVEVVAPESLKQRVHTELDAMLNLRNPGIAAPSTDSGSLS